MHNSSTTSSPFQKPLPPISKPPSSTSCPYAPPTSASSTEAPTDFHAPEKVPASSSSSWISRINPLNLMPTLPNAPTSPSQTVSLSLEREGSSIPRGPSSSPDASRGCP